MDRTSICASPHHITLSAIEESSSTLPIEHFLIACNTRLRELLRSQDSNVREPNNNRVREEVALVETGGKVRRERVAHILVFVEKLKSPPPLLAYNICLLVLVGLFTVC